MFGAVNIKAINILNLSSNQSIIDGFDEYFILYNQIHDISICILLENTPSKLNYFDPVFFVLVSKHWSCINDHVKVRQMILKIVDNNKNSGY